ncbi:threonine/serine exporter family protein [Anaeroselena agilis]|uniref:Threonine/serine exporter family protein n=1 Tax=Anaeroselena agilis TaxID=3063788 RepID=A0ABU3P163_9FIRM|nr:threonine/serine exporter family protein [Selenomonadales bacterium 4137-cl]
MKDVPIEEIVGLAVLAGEVMLRNGAETSRVEETMYHIARACGADKAECFVIPTGVFLTVSDSSGRSLTTMRRIRDRTINLDRIAKVNELSRGLAERRIDRAEALALLNRTAGERTGFSLLPSMLASGTVGGCFAVLQDGGAGETAAAFATAMAVRYIAHAVSRLHGVQFTFEFLGALAAAALGSLTHYFWPGLSRDVIVVGGIMPLVPGVAITNAIRDVIAGDLLSGLSRGLEAALTSVAVAMGVVIVLAVL